MRFSPARGTALLIALLLALTACGSGSSTPSVELSEDGSFTATTVDGAQFESAQFAGQDVMLWFWAPW